MGEEDRLRCDAFGCDETHPLLHEALGQPSFGNGRWLGWLYLDLNRPDLYERVMRFCSVACCLWWLEQQSSCRYEKVNVPVTPLDAALRQPGDTLALRRAVRGADHG